MEDNILIEMLEGLENVNPVVQKTIKKISKIANEKTQTESFDFTHYSEVEKEIRKIKHKIEECPELKPVYNELVSTVRLFTQVEYMREVDFNAKHRQANTEFFQIDSISEKDFFIIMKQIITLQAIVENEINPKFKVIVEELFEDFITILDSAYTNKEVVECPVKFYQKQVKISK